MSFWDTVLNDWNIATGNPFGTPPPVNIPANNQTSTQTNNTTVNIPNPSGQTFGLRINNPGDLRPNNFTYDGQIGLTNGSKNNGTAIFDTLTNGLRALAMDLNQKIDKDGENTINKIAEIYAPKTDGNNPTEWSNNVSNASGLGVNDILQTDNQTIGDLMWGVIFAEQGKAGLDAINDTDISNGINAYNGGFYTPSSGVNVPSNTNGLITIVFVAGAGFLVYKYFFKKQ